jgi:hypothetical protein
MMMMASLFEQQTNSSAKTTMRVITEVVALINDLLVAHELGCNQIIIYACMDILITMTSD